MKTGLLFVLALQSALAAPCLPVVSDRILGRDLALADPRFAALPATLIVGWAPAPGAKRTLSPAELTRLARANRVDLADPAELCFEVPVQQLDSAEALLQMRRVLPDTEIAVLEISRSPVPPGQPEFPLSGLEPATAAHPEIRLWRGFVRYADTKRVPVWARVSVSRAQMTVIAKSDLPANLPIGAPSVALERRSVYSPGIALRLEDVVGRVPKRSLRAGDPIPLSTLETMPDIRRGDVVTVEVRSGTARLRLSAVAERDAHSGDLLELRNPASGKTFRARLDGPKAVVVVGGAL